MYIASDDTENSTWICFFCTTLITPLSLCPHSDADHGTIRFIGPTGEVELINFYWSPESLQFGDQVEFKIGTRSYDQLVYATDLVVMEKAKDIRFKVGVHNIILVACNNM